MNKPIPKQSNVNWVKPIIKRKILKSKRKHIKWGELKIRITTELLTEKIQVKRSWNYIFKIQEKKQN
jgi:hypothetical protein